MPPAGLLVGAAIAAGALRGLPKAPAPAPVPAPVAEVARDHNILRVKGYVAVTGKPMRLLVQAVGARVRTQYDRPWGATPRTSHLVVIAEQADINEAAIRAILGA